MINILVVCVIAGIANWLMWLKVFVPMRQRLKWLRYLQQKGVRTAGVITGGGYAEGKWEVKYEAHDGRWYYLYHPADEEAVEKVTIGQPLTVCYDKDNPDNAVAEISDAKSELWMLCCFTSVIAVGGNIAVWYYIFISIQGM